MKLTQPVATAIFPSIQTKYSNFKCHQLPEYIHVAQDRVLKKGIVAAARGDFSLGLTTRAYNHLKPCVGLLY